MVCRFSDALQSGPRFARDTLGPLLSFYASWKLVGLDAGVAAATGFAVGAFAWERGQARSGLSAAIGLGIALVQAIAGLASARTIWYFAPPLIINGACGVAFLASVVIGQPLAAVFAADTYAFTPQVMASATFRDVCSRISLVWATYLLLCSAARLARIMREHMRHPHPDPLPLRGRGSRFDPLAPGGGEGQGEGRVRRTPRNS
jgi:hypothetical protein